MLANFEIAVLPAFIWYFPVLLKIRIRKIDKRILYIWFLEYAVVDFGV
jgi:hypothetical protein